MERERDSINTLTGCSIFSGCDQSPTLFDVSFQLSFLSLWGILVAAPLIAKRTASVNSPVLRGLVQFVAASIAASCATLLPVLFIFKVASFNGILTNFLVVPLLGYGAVLTGFIALPLVVLLPSYASLLLWLVATLVAISNRFIMWRTALPVCTFHGVTGWDMFFFLLFMICMIFIRSRLVLTVSGVLIPITACAFHLYDASTTDGRLHITMLSVGQAESMLARLPDGSTLLVDAVAICMIPVMTSASGYWRRHSDRCMSVVLTE